MDRGKEGGTKGCRYRGREGEIYVRKERLDR